MTKIFRSSQVHLNGYIKRKGGSTREVNLYLEVSFHEILVLLLGYDLYERLKRKIKIVMISMTLGMKVKQEVLIIMVTMR